MRSIRQHLLVYILGALGLGSAVLLGVAYLAAVGEIDEIFDENLKQVALTVATYQQPASNGRPPRLRSELPTLPMALEASGDFDFVTTTWSVDGQRIFTSAPEVHLPFVPRTGHTTTVIGDEVWHLYSIVTPDGVAQAARRETLHAALAAESAAALVPPVLALLVLIGVLLTVALRRGLRPLGDTAAALAARSAQLLEPIDQEAAPLEIAPLIASINDLMRRLSQAFVVQRRFIADASHELRSPLTALRLQLQLLERASDEAGRVSRLNDLKAGVERTQHLIEQLLSLSRVEADASLCAHEPVDLRQLAHGVIGEAIVEATHRGLDLGADALEPVQVAGDRHELTILLANLVSNAIRHTRRGCRIDVRTYRAASGDAVLEVADDGPGIPVSERDGLFERFRRGHAASQENLPSSGLGLAICKAIAGRHGASISLESGRSGRGLRVLVTFGRPLPAARQGTGVAEALRSICPSSSKEMK